MTDLVRFWRGGLGGNRGNNSRDAGSDVFWDPARTHQHPGLGTDNRGRSCRCRP